MKSVLELRETEARIISLGNHPAILQSILDFDYISGKNTPSIQAIIQSTESRKSQKFFFGEKEIFIPIFETIYDAKNNKIESNFFLNLTSARRCLKLITDYFLNYPESLGGHIFAEDVPEKISLEIAEKFGTEKFIVGPSGVGILIPGILKLGAIGGTMSNQIIKNKLSTLGNTAVVSASGGMANEIISVLSKNNKPISIAFTLGGDRFPITSVKEIFELLENDNETEYITYFGELGGEDEYEIINLIKESKLTKPVITYIAGIIDESFDKPTQFGHAKALAQSKDESARAKRSVLKQAGVEVGETFAEFEELLNKTIKQKNIKIYGENMDLTKLSNRSKSLFSTSISSEKDGEYNLLAKPLNTWIKNEALPKMIISSILGREISSEKLINFTEIALKTFLDHGPQVSGGVNTMISARAGKDLVSSVASGILTIGSRFGGATNEAARNWLNGVKNNKTAADFVEEFASQKKIVQGIGHLKYNSSMPDPRVSFLKDFMNDSNQNSFLKFALEVEKITSNKKSNLILNVDGVVAAVMLDLLHREEKYSYDDLLELVEIEFFNALFLVARTMGFTAHYLDQRRNDEGLFRLPDSLISSN